MCEYLFGIKSATCAAAAVVTGKVYRRFALICEEGVIFCFCSQNLLEQYVRFCEPIKYWRGSAAHVSLLFDIMDCAMLNLWAVGLTRNKYKSYSSSRPSAYRMSPGQYVSQEGCIPRTA